MPKDSFIPDSFVPEQEQIAPVQPVKDSFVPEQAQVAPVSSLLEAAKAGFQEQLGPMAIRGFKRLGVTQETLAQLPTGVRFPLQLAFAAEEKLKPAPGFVPTTFAEKAVSTVTSFVDPASVAFGGLAEAALAPRAIKAFGLAGQAAKFSKLSRVVQGGEALGLTSQAFKQTAGEINSRILLNQFKENVVRGVVGGGAGVAITEAARQAAEGKFKPGELALQTAVGAVGGGVLAGAATKVGQKVSKFFESRRLRLAEQTVDPAIVDNAFQFARSKADRLVADKVIPANLRGQWGQKLFLESLEQRGFNLGEMPAQLGKFEVGFINSLEVADKLDRKFGTRNTEVISRMIDGELKSKNIQQILKDQFGQPIKALENLGVSRTEATNLLQYIETTPQGQFFNPEATQFRPVFTRPAPAPEVVAELGKLRQTFDSVVQSNPEFAERAGYIQGYVPIIKKRTGVQAADIKPGSTSYIEDVFFTKRREAGLLDPAKHETDVAVLADFYSRAASNHLAFNQHLPELYGELTKLRWLGKGNEAELIAKKSMRAMGIRNRVDLNRIMGDEVLRANNILLNQLAQETVSPRAFLDEAANSVRKWTTNALVFSRLSPLVKQVIQPELIGGAEIGQRYVATGRRLLFNKEASKHAGNFMDIMLSKNTGNFAELDYDQATNKYLKFLDRASDIGAIPIKKVFDKVEEANRKSIFLGARAQFLNEARQNIEPILDGLLFGEKSMVKRALQRHGFNAAADTYALLRSRRANFAYALADNPEFFAEGLGRLIPFTTWGRNQLGRVVGDLRDKNLSKLAERVAKPLVLLTTFSALTGYRIPGAHPMAGLPEFFSAQALPAVSQTAEAVSRAKNFEGALKAAGTAASQFTPIGPVRQSLRRLEKTDDILEAFVGLRKIDRSSFAAKIRKELRP